MSDAKRKIKLSGLLIASIISTNFVFAAGAYKNNVVDVKVNRESSSAVKVTIYTDKPYSEPIVVNKKANNKYVILMPETSSSLKASPTVENLSGTVSNVSVNTQCVNGGKGYTKIVITSEKAINVVPRTQQLAGGQKSTAVNNASTQNLKQQEQLKKLAELKAQQEKAKKDALLKAQQEQTQKAAALKAQQEQSRKIAIQKSQQEKAKKAALLKAQQDQIKKNNEVKLQQERERKLAELKAKQEADKKIAQQIKDQQIHKNTKSERPIDVLEKEVETSRDAELRTNTSNDVLLNQQINENTKDEKIKPDTPVDDTQKLSVKQNIQAVLDNYENVNIGKLLLLASAITLPIIVIFLILGMDKKINKKILEKFAKREEEAVLPQNNETNDTFENIVSEEPLEVSTSVYEQVKEEVLEDNQFVNDFEKDDFTNDMAEGDVSVEQNNVETEPIEEVQKVDNVEPVEDIAQDNNLSVPDVVTNEVTDYEPDGFLSDFSQVDDNDFFDELVMRSMAEDNINGLPEESPADAVFDTITNNADINEQKDIASPVEVDDSIKSETVAETSANSNILSDSVAEDEPVMDDVLPVNTESAVIDSNDVQSEQVISEVVSEPDLSVENISEQTVEDETESDNVKMLNQISLSDNSGLYLVDYDDYSSLVGYVGEEYFVLKKFDSLLDSRILVKQTERVNNSVRYLVRVGKDKMIIEVSSNSMRRLLDL